MRAKTSVTILAIVTSLCMGGIFLGSSPRASAESGLTKSCGTIELVYARGSGQPLGFPESTRLKVQFESKIKSPLSLSFYELGTESINGHKYPAVNIGNLLNGNAIGAKLSAGQANDYGKSVYTGVQELNAYMQARFAKCHSFGSKFILAGYSQGAQVIGQYLQTAGDIMRSTITYAALFGDPKLHLPEGEGIYPPACRGKELSDYRRIVPSCHVDNGTLGARKPYLPESMKSKTGLWCYNNDSICGSSKNPMNNSGHNLYGKEGNAVDLAVQEAIVRLSKELPAEQAQHLNPTKTGGSGTTGLDVVFVIDTTGSMGWRINEAKIFASSFANTIKNMRGRVALVEYRDKGDDFTARIISPFNEDVSDFQAKLQALTIDGGGDTPEALLHALMTAFNGLSWKDGATKAAIVLTDAPFHNPDLVDGSTILSVAKRSLEIDPVNVYPVVTSYSAGQYTELANATSGQVITSIGDNATLALNEALVRLEQRPTALLKSINYTAEIGQEITFDASDSHVTEGTIVRYQWDFDGDGGFEYESTTPIAHHTYSNAFDGTMQVQLTASNGTVANASAFVTIGGLPSGGTLSTAAPTDLTITHSDTTTATLRWSPGDTNAVAWAVTVDGVAIGRVSADTTTIGISDLLRDSDIELRVAGMNAEGDIGEYSTVQLTKLDSSAPKDVVNPAQTTPEQTGASTLEKSQPRTISPPIPTMASTLLEFDTGSQPAVRFTQPGAISTPTIPTLNNPSKVSSKTNQSEISSQIVFGGIVVVASIGLLATIAYIRRRKASS